MISLKRKEDCCGCSACAGVCPKKCISIQPDNEGFYYPVIDVDVCINCGLCESVCPVINCKEEIPCNQKSYVVQNKNKIILRESTSGGAFTAFAEYILQQGGAVVGASMDSNMLVKHIIVEKKEDLFKFRSSKYVQSFIHPDVYGEIKELLNAGRWVLFSGTGCQIEAIRNYVSKKMNDKLLCIDVVCRAVPSPFIFQKYVEYQKQKNKSNIEHLRFRDKHFGYKFPTLTISYTGKKKQYHRGIESDPWLRAFFSGICNRPSCYECVFKKRYRVSDITIWDCFDYDRIFTSMTPNSGATNVLLHTEKGEKMFEAIKDSLIIEEVNPDSQMNRIKQMTESTPSHAKRTLFFQDALSVDGATLFKKYFPVRLNNIIAYYGRCVALRTGVYSHMKDLIKKVRL